MNDLEDFEDLKGYEGLYRINRNGDVFGVKTKRILEPYIDRCGYKRLGLRKNNQRKHYRLHRLLALQYLDNPEDKPIIDHIDRNKLNNCLDNLRWATRSENNSNISLKGNIRHMTINCWRVRYYYEPRKVICKCFKTQAEAEAYLEELKIKYPR